jgi:hypothetical protein
MQLFPRDGHRFSRFQVFHSVHHFFVPSIVDGFIFST